MAESLGVATLDLTTNDTRLRTGLRSAETQTSSSFGRIVKRALVAAAAVGAAWGAFRIGKSVITAAGDFEQALNVLWANAEHGKTTLAEVSKKAIQLGADAKLPAVSAASAANAMLLLAKSGFTVQQSMDAARGTLLLATAAETDAGIAAQVVTQNINAFGLHAKDTSTIVDNMAGFLRQTGTSFDQFADSLSYVASPAHTVGQSFKETAAQLAILSKNGVEGSMAGTGLRQMLVRLGSASGKAHDALKAVGVETKGADGNFIGIRATIEKLHPVLDRMTSAQRLTLMKEAFGQTAMNQANILLGTLPSKYDKMTGAVGKAGQAQRLADSMTKGFNGAMAGLVNTLQSVGLTIGMKLLPTLTEFVRWLTNEIPIAVAYVSGRIDALSSAYEENRTTVQSAMEIAKQVVIVTMQAIGAAIAFVRDSVIPAARRAWEEYGPAVKNALATAVAAVQTAVAAIRVAIDYVRTTVIPMALAAWATYGPRVKEVFDNVVTIIRGAITTITAVITTLSTFIHAHWDDIWSVIGPVVKAAFEVVRTIIVTNVKIFTGLIAAFAAVFRGDWGAVWGSLKGVAATALGSVVSIVGSILHGLAGTAKGLAILIAKGIVAGIKSSVEGLAGLAGDLTGKIAAAIGQVAGWALGAAEAIGRAIGQGIVNGVKSMAGAVAGAVANMARGAVDSAKSILHIRSPSAVFADEVGGPMADGIVIGFVRNVATLTPAMRTSLNKIADDAATMTKENANEVGDAFKSWADNAKKKLDSGFDATLKSLEAAMASGQAAIERMRVKLTPAELQIQIGQAQAAASKLQSDLNAAWVALKALKGQQDTEWATLLADQKRNLDQLVANQKAAMDDLKASAQQSTDSAILAGNTYDRQQKVTGNDPQAAKLIAAQKNYDAQKALFDQGLIDQAAFVAAANALEDAKLAASQNTNAMTLLDDYNTWQQALAAQAAAGTAITAQQALDDAALLLQNTTDAQARLDLSNLFTTQQIEAEANKNIALNTMLDANLEYVAGQERTARDAEAAALNTHLVARYQRIETHLENVKKRTDAHFEEMARSATKGGTNLIESLSQAIDDAKPTLEKALKAITTEIAKYLKVQSPTEKGPMSDLHKWWNRFGETVVSGLDVRTIPKALTSMLTPKFAASGAMMAGYGGGASGMGVAPGSNVNLTQNFNHTPANADPVAIGAVTSWQLRTLRS